MALPGYSQASRYSRRTPMRPRPQTVQSGGSGFQENSGQQLGGGGQMGIPQGANTGAQLPADRLRFDAAYAPLYRQLDEQQGRLASNFQQDSGRLSNSTQAMQRRLEQLRDQNLRGNEERMADNGILRSGINVAQQGRIGQEFLGQTNDLQSQQAMGISDLSRSLSDALSGLNSQREGLMANQARDEMSSRLEEAQARANAEAQQNYLRNLLAQQPQPTGTGVYQRPQPQANDAGYVRGLFNSYGVDPGFGANPGESADQRINRIVQELAGGRTVDNLRNSLTSLRERMRLGA